MDADSSFLYVNAGAPGSIGDAGLWTRTNIKQPFDDGLAEITSIKLHAGLEELEVSGYMLADSAFPPDKYMLQYLDYGPQPKSNKGKYNRFITNARRGVECTFGRLRGRKIQ